MAILQTNQGFGDPKEAVDLQRPQAVAKVGDKSKQQPDPLSADTRTAPAFGVAGCACPRCWISEIVD
ncbi:hypothetical protein S58_01330 [Bradyrhizobium oligotrophicum S58]|uniref:Uncharacterized protein n=1 Tax=Bradyrhizobium oligotrophicum S58 TaxID=1245469 RepID=M4YZY1_9BRAD|nr:hypothetical protein [Bradyrhizobium oligotrophicum]BAM86153.1 hypothetical protein S58_01330 [Bradyrhizobium oligotrophicum S58]